MGIILYLIILINQQYASWKWPTSNSAYFTHNFEPGSSSRRWYIRRRTAHSVETVEAVKAVTPDQDLEGRFEAVLLLFTDFPIPSSVILDGLELSKMNLVELGIVKTNNQFEGGQTPDSNHVMALSYHLCADTCWCAFNEATAKDKKEKFIELLNDIYLACQPKLV